MDISQPHDASFPQQIEQTSKRSSHLPLLIAIFVVLVGVAFVPTYLEQVKYHQTKGEIAAVNEALPDMNAAALGKIFTMLPRKVSPSAVHIQTTRDVAFIGNNRLNNLFAPQIRQQQGQASGVIVDADGYIVTNYHVISGATSVSVRLTDGRVLDAEIIGSDPETDLAVLKIDGGGKLIPAAWGNSDALEVGELVWALGNPFGLDFTLTFGIVSAKDRSVNANSRYQKYLQTDAAVNPGNSGGPLVNMIGEIVGINTAIIGPTYQGISFAIPSNVAKSVYEKILKHGEVISGYLGVVTVIINQQVATQLKLPNLQGAAVVNVLKDSPAEKAGIIPGDVIVKWNDEVVEDPQALNHFVSKTEPGDKVTIELIRDEKPVQVEVTAGKRPQGK